MKTLLSALPFSSFRPALPRFVQRGFSLVEMIVVTAIIAMMFAFAVPYTLGVLQAANLTSAGDTLMQKIAFAQQRALTSNQPVALDFYLYTKDEIKGCHAIQLASYDPVTSQTTALEPPIYWGDQNAILLEGTLSPMFDAAQTSTTGQAVQNPFQSLGATFHRIIFYPNGSTSLRVPLRTAYVTLISTKNYKPDLSDPPPNYYTIQVDPVTGRGHSYRP